MLRKTIFFALILIVLGGCSPKSKPVIGISVSGTMSSEYASSVQKAGGIPVILSFSEDAEAIDDMLSLLDGIIFTGGEDVDPARYNAQRSAKCGYSNEERDEFECALFHRAYDKGLPILGICRGQQLINVAMGGTLYQDLPSEYPSEMSHRMRHDISIEPGSTLARIICDTTLNVVSTHHQAVKDLGEMLHARAWSEDGIIESIDALPAKPIMAVQFHPESDVVEGDLVKLKIFQYFVKLSSN